MSPGAAPNRSLSRTGHRRQLLLVGSVALYVLACLLPAVLLHTGSNSYTRTGPKLTWNGYQSLKGWELLLTGWFGIFTGNFAVLANPLLWLSWLLFGSRRERGAIGFSAAALLFSMFTFELIVRPYYFDEGGVVCGYLKSIEAGFVCWVASMALILVSSIRFRWRPGS